ncbi:hypothetical protein GOP47_0020676 [Adiantum capillus-veneris]|uniref:N-alpha-acetyltransferase 40 n=1 Tax=Adiantum capillus-veneris TaxID=13818 RepID=A0A9D4UBH8_ADICA|nr:hypothetical protein GOP47_0020676 [Adiantum capillus-veneris]
MQVCLFQFELSRQKAFDNAIRRAYLKEDHLVDFPAFTKFDRNGISVSLESNRGPSLSSSLKQYVQNLLKVNMEGPYGAEWHEEEKVKEREMVVENALYIFARANVLDHHSEDEARNDRENSSVSLWMGAGAPIVAFAQYRFVMEEEVPVLYVYEIQLEKIVQGKGLGKFLMQLLELIARKNNMMAIVLTIQKRNVAAMRFYTNKLSYKISSISPSRVNPLEYADCTYEILCKTFDSQAKLVFEDAIDG